ncbi:MAG: potassium channel family protein [Phycisphaerales bacterium JB039]
MLPGRTGEVLRTYGYGVLAAMLVLHLVMSAFVEPEDPGLLPRLFLGSAVIVGVLATTPPKRRLWVAVPLAIVALARLAVWPDDGDVSLPGFVLDAGGQLVFWYLTVCLLADVLGSRFSTYPRLLAAVCLYIVAAIGFAAIYRAIDASGADDAGDGAAFMAQGERRKLDESEVLYFSFVTQTTLGYGDIAPVSQPARAVAIMQATGGVLYLAVLVAAIVSGRQRETAEGE